MSLFKMMFGALVAAVVMFIAGFIFYATPLSRLAYVGVEDTAAAAVQSSIAQNLPATGSYLIPDPATQAGTMAYAKGPIAMVHVSRAGAPVADMNVLIWGFAHEIIICFILGWALMGIDRRIPDYVSRLKTVLLFSVASSGFIHLGNPIWYHLGWTFSVYHFVADALILTLAGAILARWFLPVKAQMP